MVSKTMCKSRETICLEDYDILHAVYLRCLENFASFILLGCFSLETLLEYIGHL
jgi:hypothetical protein